MGLFAGLAAPFRGVAFVARRGLWFYLAAPLALNAVAAAGGAWVGVALLARFTGEVWFSVPWIDAVARGLVAALFALLAFIALQPLVSAPFIDFLTEKVEAIVRGVPPPNQGFFPGLGQAVVQGALKTVLYLFALAVTFTLGALTGLGGALGLLLYGLFLAFDGFDYPLGRRGVGFVGKWRYLFARPGLIAGYAVGAGLLFLVPLAAFVVPAFAAVGATLAFLDEERAGRGGG